MTNENNKQLRETNNSPLHPRHSTLKEKYKRFWADDIPCWVVDCILQWKKMQC